MSSSPLKRDSRHQPAGQGGAEARARPHDLKTTVKQASARATVVGPKSCKASEVGNEVCWAGSSPEVVNGSNELARHVRNWHASQGDRLPNAQCHHVIAALQDCSGWSTLLQRSSGRAALSSEALRPVTDRLKQFGYTAEAATALVSFVIGRYSADETGSQAAGSRSGIV